VQVELTSVSAIRGVTPHQVLEVVERWFDDTGLAHGHRPATAAQPGDVCISGADGWSWVGWPAYFAPRDLAASQVLSRELHAVVSTVATTTDEGWSHTLLGCGTVVDRFHSYPAGLAWDDGDVAALAAEWSGDHELVARVFGVPACGVRRHFCQATTATRDHPGRDRDGYLGLWSALGIRVDDATPYAVLAVDRAWQQLPA